MLAVTAVGHHQQNRTLGSVLSMRLATDCSCVGVENQQSVQIADATTAMPIPKDGFAARLHEALDDLGWPQRGRASKLRGMLPFTMSEKGVKKWLDGESRPEQDKLAIICAITGCLGEWLLTGIGPKKQATGAAAL